MAVKKAITDSENTHKTLLDKKLIRHEIQSALSELMLGKHEHSLSFATKHVSIKIPLSIFCEKKLGVLEALVKYLREEEGLTLKEIALIIKKDNKSLWVSYNNARKKVKKPFVELNDFVPLRLFSGSRLSCFESIVLNLKDKYGVSYNRMAVVFGRSYKTIWTTYKRAKRKYNGKA